MHYGIVRVYGDILGANLVNTPNIQYIQRGHYAPAVRRQHILDSELHLVDTAENIMIGVDRAIQAKLAAYIANPAC